MDQLLQAHLHPATCLSYKVFLFHSSPTQYIGFLVGAWQQMSGVVDVNMKTIQNCLEGRPSRRDACFEDEMPILKLSPNRFLER
jgi:hypothetical protein